MKWRQKRKEGEVKQNSGTGDQEEALCPGECWTSTLCGLVAERPPMATVVPTIFFWLLESLGLKTRYSASELIRSNKMFPRCIINTLQLIKSTLCLIEYEQRLKTGLSRVEAFDGKISVHKLVENFKTHWAFKDI